MQKRPSIFCKNKSVKTVGVLALLWLSVMSLQAQPIPGVPSGEFEPALMAKQKIESVTLWRVPCDSSLSVFSNPSRIIIGNMEEFTRFDRNGNTIENGNYIQIETNPYPLHYYYHTYDDSARLVSTRYFFAYNRTDTGLIREHRYFYSGLQPAFEIIYSSGRQMPSDSIIYHHDSAGRLHSRVYHHELPGNYRGKRLLETYTYYYRFTPEGYLAETRWEDFSEVRSRTLYTWDEKGRQTGQEYYSGDSPEPVNSERVEYKNNQKIVTHLIGGSEVPLVESVETWFYDADGLPTGYYVTAGEGSEPVCYLLKYRKFTD